MPLIETAAIIASSGKCVGGIQDGAHDAKGGGVRFGSRQGHRVDLRYSAGC